ncbi:MAG: AbrB/MazE/SpoVT family DNA-binding domain-containing protein [Archaeoglobus sp.]|uniref:AbrB/MazE/SpoVT family DNA-binding domain-containing protein n=1 Tax=Archaeoglobus sp. TaxID=1872626 RepID=UPI001DDD70C7|nr:AbrB/MazE/SpoVT family DNA-binding domain-containing protein [Archaeoglobus sp.]
MSANKLKVKLKRTGNSLSVTIPSAVLKLLGWSEGDYLEIDVDTRAGLIIIKE